MLDIQLFGETKVTVAGTQVVEMPSRRALWLLAILGLREGRPIERTKLAGLLWPDSSDDAALHNLRQTLAGLRRVLGPVKDCIESVSPRSLVLRKTSDIRIDVLEFDAACASESLADLEYASELYRENLLAGCEEPFADAERSNREVAFLNGADRLASHYISIQNYAAAIAVLRRSIAIDPFRESSYRALMVCLAESNEMLAAQILYRELRSRLNRDLNIEPSEPTKELYQSLRSRPLTRMTIPETRSKKIALPVPLSSLVGRDKEVERVSSLVSRCRLVTLTGVGGVGKTRLAIAVSEAVQERFVDGVRFVDLAPVSDPAMIPSTIAMALTIKEDISKPIIQSLLDHIRESEILLVLDNCEHLVQDLVPTLDLLLSSSRNLHVLATSRQSLGVNGELISSVPSLAVPDVQLTDSPEHRSNSIKHSESVQLFMERCGEALPNELSLTDLESIGAICQSLDGLPLAIELASARTNFLTVGEIEDRLTDRFALLTGSNRTIGRHKTLKETIEWSWSMLDENEQDLLARMSVFKGGSTLEAIEGLVRNGPDSQSTLALVASLVDKSLLTPVRNPQGSRFVMLESIRQFSEEKLRDRGDLESALNNHRDYFLAWLNQSTPAPATLQEPLWFEKLEQEHDNLRAALDWCHLAGDRDKEIRLAVGLSRFWDTHGHLNEGRRRMELVLTNADDDQRHPLWAGAHVLAGWMATVQHDCPTACDHFERAISVFSETGDDVALASAYNCLGTATNYAGEYETAIAHFEEAFRIYQKLGRKGGIAMVLNNLAEVALGSGKYDKARIYLEGSLEQGATLNPNNPQRHGLTLLNLSFADYLQGQFDDARKNAAKALIMFRDSSLVVDMPAALNMMGLIFAGLQHWTQSACLLGSAAKLASDQNVPITTLHNHAKEAAINNVRNALGSALFDAHYDKGQRMSIHDAISFALSFTNG